MKPDPNDRTKKGTTAPPTEPRKGCVNCDRPSNTMYSRITVDKGVRKVEGPFCQTCWEKK